MILQKTTICFSRKGLFAPNVQCIVDDRKKVLWVSYSHNGGSHDSSCFKERKRYGFMETVREVILHILLNHFTYHYTMQPIPKYLWMILIFVSQVPGL